MAKAPNPLPKGAIKPAPPPAPPPKKSGSMSKEDLIRLLQDPDVKQALIELLSDEMKGVASKEAYEAVQNHEDLADHNYWIDDT